MKASWQRLASRFRSKDRTAWIIRPRSRADAMTATGPGLTRRAVVAGAGALGLAGLTGCNSGTGSAKANTGRLAETRIGNMPVTLTAQERPLMLGADTGPTPAWL